MLVYNAGVARLKKVTVELSEELLERARDRGEGITETIRDALELRARQRAGKRLLRWVGKVKFPVPLDELRKDRD